MDKLFAFCGIGNAFSNGNFRFKRVSEDESNRKMISF
jgi:hypothetical protein